MSKKHLKIIAVGIVVASLAGMAVFGMSKAYAQSAESSEGTVRILGEQCDVLETRLKIVQNTELAARIKRGRTYDQELMAFMSSFNSRIAANNVDAPELLRIASEIKTATGTSEFGRLYTVYADDLSSAIDSNCGENPQETYGWIEKARADRQALADKVKEIDKLVGEYIVELKKLEKRFTPAINKPDTSAENDETQ